MSNNTIANEPVATKTEEKKVIRKIEVSEPLPFDANIKSCFMNTIELAGIVDNLFSSAMRDYVGCKISLNNGDVPANAAMDIPMGKLYVNLYFKDRSNLVPDDNGMIPNVTRRSESKGKSKFDSLMKMSGVSAGRMYDVTPETYEALDPFRFFPNRKTNWNILTTEIYSNFGYAGSYNQEIVACITGIDFEKVINAVYGTRTEEGIFQYQAAPVQIVANVNGEYVVQITQLDITKLDDMRKSLGGPIARTEFHQCVR